MLTSCRRVRWLSEFSALYSSRISSPPGFLVKAFSTICSYKRENNNNKKNLLNNHHENTNHVIFVSKGESLEECQQTSERNIWQEALTSTQIFHKGQVGNHHVLNFNLYNNL